jgi:hypothetical protein
MRYHIKSERGYWLPGGYGYTQDHAEAGVFSLADMEAFNLDGCSLERAAEGEGASQQQPVQLRAVGECQDCGAMAPVAQYSSTFDGDRMLCAECIEERNEDWWEG